MGPVTDVDLSELFIRTLESLSFRLYQFVRVTVSILRVSCEFVKS
jgi:hypothetical protein